jgi:hypothetical protein
MIALRTDEIECGLRLLILVGKAKSMIVRSVCLQSNLKILHLARRDYMRTGRYTIGGTRGPLHSGVCSDPSCWCDRGRARLPIVAWDRREF